MPFCRKCGRRLCEYSESCPECGTSTTAALIKIKKAPAARVAKAAAPTKVAKAVIPAKAVISVKVIAPNRAVKAVVSAKAAAPAKLIITKPVTPAVVYPPHEIIKSNLSLEEDIITNPQDYETQTFNFDLKCQYDHFWPEGKALPVSKGKAFCPECGERLRKPKRSQRHR
jgi:RNA polymerase subunit RPABC4/transcription elongation factor Spt4